MKEEYKTKDLAEASALLVEGQQIIRVERENRICWFVFNNKEKCEDLSNRYFFGNLLVEARKYYEAMTRLKNRIFSV